MSIAEQLTFFIFNMVKIAVLGGSEFVVGFQLAGVRDVIEVTGDYFNELDRLKNQKDIGIVVVDEKIMDSLDIYQKTAIEASVEPVFIPLSTKDEQDSLKRLIKKSIGVDLWK
ncbi:hypothetical protein HYW99_02800 [Candidatus Woesearchaeota archaeon]|nr:hypothetical protein [Candidatus Woesearchaeota archaeon]